LYVQMHKQAWLQRNIALFANLDGISIDILPSFNPDTEEQCTAFLRRYLPLVNSTALADGRSIQH
jgi:hypothetical protein